MSTLVNVPKNGSLQKTNTNTNVPSWTTWLDDFFNRDIPAVLTSNYNTGLSIPKVNIKENTDAFILELAAPGLTKTDFKIDLDNHVLSIASEVENKEESDTDNYMRREFSYASFKKSFTLPDTIDEEKIDAKYNDGILYVKLPKREEAKQKPARSINIS